MGSGDKGEAGPEDEPRGKQQWRKTYLPGPRRGRKREQKASGGLAGGRCWFGLVNGCGCAGHAGHGGCGRAGRAGCGGCERAGVLTSGIDGVGPDSVTNSGGDGAEPDSGAEAKGG